MNTVTAIGTAWRLQINDGYPSELEKVSYFAITDTEIYVSKKGYGLIKKRPLSEVKCVPLKSEFISYFLNKQDAINFVSEQIGHKAYDLNEKIERLKKSLKIQEYE